MVSKVICLFLLGMLHASADSDETTKLVKSMAKAFVPAAAMARPRVTGGARLPVGTAHSNVQSGASMQSAVNVQSGASMQSAVSKTLVDLEERNQEMKVAYQRLRARIQKMPQTDDQASFGSAASLGWLAGLIASVGLAASVGVAVRQHAGHGRHGSESEFDSQISLMPQRAGLVMASVAARTVPVIMQENNPPPVFSPPPLSSPVFNAVEDQVALPDPEFDAKAFAQSLPGITGPLGFWDPAGFCEVTATEGTATEGKIRFYREVEVKHARVAMLAALGYPVAEVFHPLFGGQIDGPSFNAFQQTPLQTFWPAVVLAIGIIEVFSIIPAFEDPNIEGWAIKKTHSPGDLGFDPLGLKPTDPAELVEMQNKELNNGRLAMIAIVGMIVQEGVTGAKLF